MAVRDTTERNIKDTDNGIVVLKPGDLSVKRRNATMMSLPKETPRGSIPKVMTTFNSRSSSSYNLKQFFQERIQTKKEFGERVTTADRNTLRCKRNLNNFFSSLIDY